ncbi:cold-shock protein [Bradyrhizobium sp. BWC-3-1]|uniref:cold-shock protein n=1 Tax=Bradyrhizobium sp. BWC-3-1 TaxID=3080012 RepID=UPI00397CF128
MNEFQGSIRYYSEKGFGFIRRDDRSADVFFHVSQFMADIQPEAGMRVSFDISDSQRTGRQQAVGLQIL